MGKIKSKYSRYGLKEWTAFFLGLALNIIQIVLYALGKSGPIELETLVFIAGFLLMFSPLTLLNLIRQIKGQETK